MKTPEFVTPQEEYNLLRDRLTKTYQEIEERAFGLIEKGKVVDNPILTREKPDTRYGLSTIGMITGLANTFLQSATEELQGVEPEMHTVPHGFRHITLREIYFSPQGRLVAHIDAQAAAKYYQAIREKFSKAGTPIRLALIRVLPAIDKEQDSVSIVGAFVPQNDTRVAQVRSEINHAVEQADLPLIGRLGDIRVLFSTLGRLPHPPRRDGETVPLLDALRDINARIPEECETVVSRIDMISTTPISFIWVDKHVYMDPPISLVNPHVSMQPRFISARHKQILDRLEEK